MSLFGNLGIGQDLRFEHPVVIFCTKRQRKSSERSVETSQTQFLLIFSTASRRLKRKRLEVQSSVAMDPITKEEPGRDEFEECFRFDNDLAFLAEVARRLARLAAQPGLDPEKAKGIDRAAAALKKLPELTPGIDVQIEIAHRMGGEEFSESYSYTVKIDPRRVEICSSGSQCDPAAGTNSFILESLTWHANGQVEYKGNRGTWLERVSYALARQHTLRVTDQSELY